MRSFPGDRGGISGVLEPDLVKPPGWPEMLLPLLCFSVSDHLVWYNRDIASDILDEDVRSWIGVHLSRISRAVPSLAQCRGGCPGGREGYSLFLGEHVTDRNLPPVILYSFKPRVSSDGSYFIAVSNNPGGALRPLQERRQIRSSVPAIDSSFSMLQSLELYQWHLDHRTGRLEICDALAAFLGMPEDPMIACNPYVHLEVIHESDRAAVHSAGSDAIEFGRPYDITYRIWTASGELALARSICGSVITPGTSAARLSGTTMIMPHVSADIERSFHDSLTGLLNRHMFDRDLEACFQNGRKDRRFSFALALCDLDDLKLVNDLLGHAVGDQYLQLAGARLSEMARADINAYRIGGDEFALIFSGNQGIRHARAQVRMMQQEFNLATRRLFGSAPGRSVAGMSIGLTEGHCDDRRASHCYERADRLLYENKRARKRTGQVPGPLIKI